MKKICYHWFVGLLSIIMLHSCGNRLEGSEEMPDPHVVSSPSENIDIRFFLDQDKRAAYQVLFNGSVVIDTSRLGFVFKDQPELQENLKVLNVETNSVNETWEMPWGEQKEVINHYNELIVQLEEENQPKRKFNVIFRAFNDGIGFRYKFPEQDNLDEIIILNEQTEFQLTDNHTAWWSPGDWDSYEHPYTESTIAEIDALKFKDNTLAQSHIVENAVNTPVTMKTDEGIYLSFHEADLTDYAGMTLKVNPDNYLLKSSLVGSDLQGYKVKREVPFSTPWRTIQITDEATELIASRLIENLNDPNVLGDVEWFDPMKYMGIWWEMHLNKSSWDMASGKHGATTENAKRYINFAAENNIGGLLIEGWNTGWERWIGFPDREGVFDFVTPYSDYDLNEVVRYADEKGVDIIMHHETSAAPRTYEQQLDTAYSLMNSLGIHAVKTGYVGPIIPEGEYHHGQWMVNHYMKVHKKAAEYQIAVNTHEPIKPTGKRRTYPNIVSAEGLRGQEFNAWAADGGNPPEHLPIVAFTRMLAGPIDYTPGIFNIKLDPYKPDNQVNNTLANQLALFVVIYSPLQMAADLVESYEGHPAFQFIRDVGVDWDRSVVLNGEVGDYVTIARQERDTENWFLGSITDENERELSVKLDFLDSGKEYIATIYKDAPDTHFKTNPTAYEIEKMEVNNTSELKLKLAPGGGAAISIMPVE